MSSLFTAAQQSGLESLRDAVFDTFARPIVAYRVENMTVLNSDLNYKYSYGLQPESIGGTDYTSYNIQSGVISGVIKYDNTLDKLFSNPQGSRDENFRVVTDAGFVRVKIRQADFETYIKNSTSIVFDGKNFSLYRTERPHGVFTPRYYTLYLQYQN